MVVSMRIFENVHCVNRGYAVKNVFLNSNCKKADNFSVLKIYKFDFIIERQKKMLRSKVPSIVAKRKSLGQTDNNENQLITNGVSHLNPDDDNVRHNPKRSCKTRRVALISVKNSFTFRPNLKLVDDILRERESHNDLIQKILNRPFKIPIDNYAGLF